MHIYVLQTVHSSEGNLELTSRVEQSGQVAAVFCTTEGVLVTLALELDFNPLLATELLFPPANSIALKHHLIR